MSRFRLPRPRRSRVEPNRPHPFAEPHDAGLGSVASGGLGSGFRPGMNNILLTSAYMRDEAARPDARCAVPGCDGHRQHPIHEAVE